ncbi:helix-turn-helix domain-containing protein [Ktedonobacter robiniae]|uniref:helix-turn-helix domain-containing protein n=1 Tax=Ktedonobacter robiniae TaxID=2778365 RepID=UPI0019157EDA|nr:helix-turn-helix transcriptional regulator [Ktedonobacter robiniae]
MASNHRLKQVRELRGWSQAKVAEQIGTDATTVSRWERGLFSPTPYFREKLCALFDQNAEELGLLESSRRLCEEGCGDLPLQPPGILSSPHAHGERSREEICEEEAIPPVVPSCTYIVHIRPDHRTLGIALALLVISAFFLGGFSFKEMYPLVSPSSSGVHAFLPTQENVSTKGRVPDRSSNRTIPLLTPTPSPAPSPTPAISSVSVIPSSSSLEAEADPRNLTPQECSLETLGYRCDVKLWFYTNGQGASSWIWKTGPATLPVQFTPLQGTGQPGQPCQLTLYIHSTPGQRGQLTFTITSSVGNATAMVTWQG